MVVVSKGKTMLSGDSIDIAIDVLTFMGSINELKKNDPKGYKTIKCAMKGLIEDEELRTLDVIKEFAINMKEILS